MFLSVLALASFLNADTDNVTRIAYGFDKDDQFVIDVSTMHGPLKDGLTEINKAYLYKDGNRQAILLAVQKGEKRSLNQDQVAALATVIAYVHRKDAFETATAGVADTDYTTDVTLLFTENGTSWTMKSTTIDDFQVLNRHKVAVVEDDKMMTTHADDLIQALIAGENIEIGSNAIILPAGAIVSPRVVNKLGERKTGYQLGRTMFVVEPKTGQVIEAYELIDDTVTVVPTQKGDAAIALKLEPGTGVLDIGKKALGEVYHFAA